MFLSGDVIGSVIDAIPMCRCGDAIKDYGFLLFLLLACLWTSSFFPLVFPCGQVQKKHNSEQNDCRRYDPGLTVHTNLLASLLDHQYPSPAASFNTQNTCVQSR